MSSRIPIQIRILFACELALAVVFVVDWSIGSPVYLVTRMVNLDGEANLPTWFSSMQLFSLGALLVGVAGPVRAWRDRRIWPVLAMAALCFGMSCEEVVQIHEWAAWRSNVLLPGGTRDGTILKTTGLWPFLFAPPFLAAVVALSRGFRRLLVGRPVAARRYLLGVATYAASIFLVELLANFTVHRRLASIAQIVCEELGEMAGVTLMIWATLDLLAARRPHIVYQPKSDLQRFPRAS